MSCRTESIHLGPWAIALVFSFALPLSAQTVSLRLRADLNSKMPTGTLFQAEDSAGHVYHGHLVTHRARRMLRNGSMMLVFDEPMKPITDDREGAFRGGNKVRLLKLAGSLAVAKLADDCVDGALGASKARYLGAATAAGFLLLTKGQEAKLHAGDTIDVSVGR